jgi:hypothetical protein
VRDAWDCLARQTRGAFYSNDLGCKEEGPSKLAEAAFGANYARLVDIKTKYDPTNVFCRNHNIPLTKVGRMACRTRRKQIVTSEWRRRRPVINRALQMIWRHLLATLGRLDGTSCVRKGAFLTPCLLDSAHGDVRQEYNHQHDRWK